MNLTIFNSWQSDGKYNRQAIRTALREACTKLELQISDLHLKTDEATSNQTGALHIPNAVLQNISNSDIFIADVSTIGRNFDGSRKIQNPNVLIELGYAISQIGWNRIVLVLNKENGDIEDLPFDIEKRSCLTFRIVSDDDKNGIGQLRENFITRLSQIIEANPDKPQLQKAVIGKAKANDFETIRRLFIWMPIREMDEFLKHGPQRIKKSLIGGANQFCEFKESITFHVNDKLLKRRLIALYNLWQDMFRQMPKNYTAQGNDYRRNNSKSGRRKAASTDFIIQDIDKMYISLLKFIRTYYPEIDI